MNTTTSKNVPFFARKLDRQLIVRTGIQAGHAEQLQKGG